MHTSEVPMPAELRLTFDENMRPVSAECSRCHQAIPMPGPDVRDPIDMMHWLSEQFLLHKMLHAPLPSDAQSEEP
jgi:hypothetical protein